jgi:membrane-bound lytic murein transglycosylase D
MTALRQNFSLNVHRERGLMKHILLCVLSVLSLNCSSEKTTRSNTEINRIEKLVKELSISDSTILLSPIDSVSHMTSPGTVPADTVHNRNISGTVAPGDSLEDESALIAEKLELARQHYLAALNAQEAGDSTLCEREFEQAITVLDELSYFPDIESNKDFTELMQSVLDDYDKYVAAIDQLGPDAPAFALREKANLAIETNGPTEVNVPNYDVEETAVPLPFNDYVGRAISFFLSKGREHFERWMYLSGKYLPVMEKIFREEGVPVELVYLSMTESGLRPDARSRARAVGLWQFIKGTASLYGLRMNFWYDERRDFEKATRAAARHLMDLFSELGDWNLVLASYNAGVGKVYRAIRRSGKTDYWSMRKYLPRQTRNYVPQYIAIARMALEPEKYGFRNLPLADPLKYDVVAVDDGVDLKVLASCAETDVATLQELNPELLHPNTPPGVTGYRLRIPQGRKDVFARKFAAVPADQKKQWVVHKVRGSETLGAIARKYGLTVSVLKEVNDIRSERRLNPGSMLAIPVSPEEMEGTKVPFDYDLEAKKVSFGKGKEAALAQAKSDASRPSNSSNRTLKNPRGKSQLVYTVKRGDTIGHVAEWYGVRASDIRNWNDIGYRNYIQPGLEMTIWVDQDKADALRKIDGMSFAEKEEFRRGEVGSASNRVPRASSGDDQSSQQGWVQYRVREGDAIEKIAKQYGISVSDLRIWNGLRGNNVVVGQSLDIYSEPEERAPIILTAPDPQKPLAGDADKIKSAASEQTHRVRKGETLSDIARAYGVTTRELMQHNKLRSSKVKINQVLRIPSSAAATSSNSYHKVRRGDTLWDISREYDVSVEDLQASNDVADGIHPGDRLLIPSR